MMLFFDIEPGYLGVDPVSMLCILYRTHLNNKKWGHGMTCFVCTTYTGNCSIWTQLWYSTKIQDVYPEVYPLLSMHYPIFFILPSIDEWNG